MTNDQGRAGDDAPDTCMVSVQMTHGPDCAECMRLRRAALEAPEPRETSKPTEDA